MKKTNKLWIVALGMAGAGFLLLMIGNLFGGRVSGIGFGQGGIQVYSPNLTLNGKKITYKSGEEKLDKFENLNMNISDGDIKIEPSDHYGISYYMREDHFDYEVKDNTLTVNQGNAYSDNNIRWLFFSGMFVSSNSYEQEWVTLYVPKEVYFQEIAVKNAYGDASVSGLMGDKISINLSSGEVEVRDVTAEDFTLKADYGDVSIEQLSGADMKIGMSSGKLEAEKVTGSNLEVKNSYGDISLEEIVLEEAADIKASSGTITLDKMEVPELEVKNSYGDTRGEGLMASFVDMSLSSGDCILKEFDTDDVEIRSSYGSVRLDMVKSLDDYEYDLRTDYGDVYIEEDNVGDSYRDSNNSGDNLIDISCSSGDIEINQAK